MKNKIETSIIGVIILLIILLISIVWQPWMSTEVAEEDKEVITVLATYESEEYQIALQVLCNQYTQIEGTPDVELIFVAQSDFEKEVCIEKDQETLADVIIYENVMTEALVSMEVLADISDYMMSGKYIEFITTGYTSTMVDGKSYGVPFTCDPYVLFYNKDIIEEPSTNLGEFYTQLEESHLFGRYDLGFSMKNNEEIASVFFQMVYSAGGNIRALDSENSTSVYAFYEQMRDQDMISEDMINWNQEDVIQMFAEKQISTSIMELSTLASLETMALDFEYGIMEIPYVMKETYLFHGENIGVTTGADYEEAIAFVDYCTSKDQMEQFDSLAKCLPVRSDYYYNPGEEYGLSDTFVLKQKSQSIDKTSFSTWFIISESISNHMTEFLWDKTIDVYELGENLYEDIRNAILAS